MKKFYAEIDFKGVPLAFAELSFHDNISDERIAKELREYISCLMRTVVWKSADTPPESRHQEILTHLHQCQTKSSEEDRAITVAKINAASAVVNNPKLLEYGDAVWLAARDYLVQTLKLPDSPKEQP